VRRIGTPGAPGRTGGTCVVASSKRASAVLLMDGRAAVRYALAVAFTLAAVGPAFAAEKDFDIRTQDAPSALAEFGRQAGTEILFEFDVIQGRRTHPLVGRYEPIEALRLLTAGTDLRVSQSPDGVLIVECDCHTARDSSVASAARPSDARPTEGSVATAGSAARAAAAKATQRDFSPRHLEEMVVTGSRIRQDPLSAPMPLLTISRPQLQDSGAENLADVITQLPSIGVGVGLANSRQLIVGAGLSLIDLRNLGVDRTLVLVNGRRQVSGQPLSAAVDLNTLPAELVDRVEVVTAGTSAVYGADAIGGVVNVILRRDFDGLSVRGAAGITSRGDGASRGASVTGGRNFEFHDHPGNAAFSFNFDDASGVQASSRGYASNGLDVISNPAGGGPNFIHANDVTFNIVSAAGHFTVGGQTWIFTPDGNSIRPFDFGPLGDRSGRSIGGDGVNAELFDPLRLPIQRKVFSGTLRYGEPEAELFLETRIASTQIHSTFQPTFDDGDVQLQAGNPFLPPAAVARIEDSKAQSVALHRIVDEMGVRGTDNDRLMQQYVAGVDLTLPNKWRLEVAYSFGHTRESTVDLDDRDTARFVQSLDAIRDPLTGQIVCRDPSNGCVPLDLVGIGHASPEALAFSRVNSSYDRAATQQVASASLGGDFPALPAGPARFAAGMEYRRESARSEPSAAAQRGGLFLPRVAATGGAFDVHELFGELHLPLLRSHPRLDELSLNGAARLSDYSTSGREWAWHTGLEYAPVPELRLRSVVSRSVRAPNIGELFSPESQTYFFGQDPCDASMNRVSATRLANCQALGVPVNFNAPTNGQTLLAVVAGNPALVPEVGDTWTAGFVYRPQRATHLSLAADYWNITIHQAIGPVPPQTIADGCVDSTQPVALNPQCAQVMRDPGTHGIVSIQTINQNIARISAAGLDVQLVYRNEVPRGDLEATLVTTWLRQLDSLADAGDPGSLTAAQGVIGNPRWRALGTLTYRTGGLRATWRTQFIGSTRIAWFPGIPNNEYDLPDTGTKLFHDLAVGLRLGEHARVHLNINNVLDTKPPARGNLIHSGIGVGATLYPNLGRTFLGSFEYQF
jgi:iron complex outermembrane recepter protein